MALGRRWGDGSQQAGLNAASESFWRCVVAAIWLLLWWYVWDFVCVCVLCAAFSLRYVPDILRAVFSLCCVQSLVCLMCSILSFMCSL